MLVVVLPTELLREAMDHAREGGGSALAALQFAIGTAEATDGVDKTLIEEAKTLHATQPLQTAMAGRDVAKLRAAIEVAEGNADVDRTVVEVSGCWHTDSHDTHLFKSRIHCLYMDIRKILKTQPETGYYKRPLFVRYKSP